MEEEGRRILIVDDSPAIHEDFRKILARTAARAGLEDLEAELFGVTSTPKRRLTYQLDSAFQGQDAVEKVVALLERGERYALAFVDMRMPPGWDGLTTIEHIWAVDPEVQIVICTAYSDHSWEDILARFEQTDRLLVLKKPFDNVEVAQLACSLTEKWRLARHAHLKLNQLNGMVAEKTQELKQANVELEKEIQERRVLEESLRASETRYALAAAGSSDGLWDWDVVVGTIYYSARWKALLGFAEDEITTSIDEWMERVHPDDRHELSGAIRSHFEGWTDALRVEYRMLHRDGQYRWVLTRGVAVRDQQGRVVRAAGSQSDITDRRLAEEQLRHEAFHDALTGLPNRALFLNRLTQALDRSRRAGETFAVLFLDLDRFKGVNDSLGHLAGDQVLIAAAQRLSRGLRVTDSAVQGGAQSIARIGGDEFVILLRELRRAEDALRVAERLQKRLAEPWQVEGNDISLSATIGIAISGPQYLAAEDLLRDADTALYRAKAARRGSCAVFDAEMHAAALSRWRMENELRHAIERGELRLAYQPIVDLQSMALVEVEALLRWNPEGRGSVSPAEFIPVAEENGLMIAIGKWVLNTACKQLRDWDQQFGEAAQFGVAVNVCAHQLAEPDFAKDVAEVLKEHAIDPSRLRLEVTESALIGTGEVWQSTVAQLRAMNVRLHLDDFGTGYSSLSYLSRISFDALKIDRSFISSMASDRASVAIVQAVITLGHMLGKQVVAEGVETPEQLLALRRLQCDSAQGFLFSRPQFAADLESLLGELQRWSKFRPSTPALARV